MFDSLGKWAVSSKETFFQDCSCIFLHIFQTDWNDGRVLCNLVVSVGGNLGDCQTGSDIERIQYGMFTFHSGPYIDCNVNITQIPMKPRAFFSVIVKKFIKFMT